MIQSTFTSILNLESCGPGTILLLIWFGPGTTYNDKDSRVNEPGPAMNPILTDEQSAFLTDRGIDLAAVIATDDLASAVIGPLREAGVAIAPTSRLIVLGNAGRSLWQSVRRQQEISEPVTDHPVDDYSRAVAQAFIDQFLSADTCQLLYPSSLPVSLISLGEFCGWSSPSQLGMGIHPGYGLWFAYRAVILTDAPLPAIPRQASTDVCASCTAKPCVAACPGRAVSEDSAFNLQACTSWRLKKDSECELSCAARKACPVGQAFSYQDDQLAYHMGRSLPSLRRWSSGRSRDDS